MKFVVDESVSYVVVEKLQEFKHEVAKDFSSIKDQDVYKLTVAEKAVLITRDHHQFYPFSSRENKRDYLYQARKPKIRRRGVKLVLGFVQKFIPESMGSSLIILQKRAAKIRPARSPRK